MPTGASRRGPVSLRQRHVVRTSPLDSKHVRVSYPYGEGWPFSVIGCSGACDAGSETAIGGVGSFSCVDLRAVQSGSVCR